MIISARRTKEEKRSRDLEAAQSILEYLFQKPRELSQIRKILGEMPKAWLKTLRPIAEKEFPPLVEMM